jgi:hypothetical protein
MATRGFTRGRFIIGKRKISPMRNKRLERSISVKCERKKIIKINNKYQIKADK